MNHRVAARCISARTRSTNVPQCCCRGLKQAAAYFARARLCAELVQLVRDQIGAVTGIRQVDVVAALPRTRSGKILRKVLSGIADGGDPVVPATIEDSSVLDALRPVLHPGPALASYGFHRRRTVR